MDAGNFNDGPIDLSSLDMKEYEDLFHWSYHGLCLHAYKIVRDWNTSEDLVQDFFARCWQRRNMIRVQETWMAFASRSVRNAALNYIKKEQTRIRYEKVANPPDTEEPSPTGLSGEDETDRLYFLLLQAIQQLPEQRRKAFILSRQEDMKYADIARELNISINTVKMHLKLAYRALRDALKMLLFFFFF